MTSPTETAALAAAQTATAAAETAAQAADRAVSAATTRKALSDLLDVSVAGLSPVPGQTLALVYNETSGLWEPGTIQTGGPAVGEWEVDQVATFTLPAPVEQVIAVPLDVPVNRPAAPQISVTVTQEMLVTCDLPTLGFVTALAVYAAVYNPGGANGNLNVEVQTTPAGTGAPTIVGTSLSAGPTTSQRGTACIITPEVQVGDVVEMRLWATSGTVGYKCDWWARRSFPNRMGSATPDAERKFLYRGLSVLATAGNWTPGSTLSNAPTAFSISTSPRVEQWLDSNVLHGSQGSDPSTTRPLLAMNKGVCVVADPDIGGATISQTLVHTTAQIPQNHFPVQMQFDRIAVPTPPA